MTISRSKVTFALMAGLAAILAPTVSAEEGRPAIHLRSTGTGDPCWVLLHPFGASGRFWERRAEILAKEHSARIYYPDLPSHGLSQIVETFDYQNAAQAIEEALRTDCPRPSIIVGASSGGIVAMKLAARTPAPVAAIGVGWSFTEANLAAMRAQAARPAEPQDPFAASFAEQGPQQFTALRRHFGDLAARGTTPLLTPEEGRALTGRLLILQGEADDFFLRDNVDQLVRNVPGTIMVTFPGAGHLEPLAPANSGKTWASVAKFSARTIGVQEAIMSAPRRPQ